MKKNQFDPPIFTLKEVLGMSNYHIQKDFFTHGLIVIKSKTKISEESLKKLSNKFGTMYANPSSGCKFFYKDKYILEVAGDKMFGTGAMNWHKDMSYVNNSYYGTLLYNSSQHNATTTQFIYTKQSSFTRTYKTFKYGAYSGNTHLSDNERNVLKLFKKNEKLRNRFANYNPQSLSMKPVKKKFLIKHPITKKNIIYFSPGTALTSKRIINRIEKDILNLNKGYIHEWSNNDILMFDNLQLMHKRNKIDNKRKLLRLQFNYENFSHK